MRFGSLETSAPHQRIAVSPANAAESLRKLRRFIALLLNVPACAAEVDLIRRLVTLRRMNSSSLRVGLLLLGILLGGCASPTKSQEPPSTAAASTQPSYPVTYAAPTVEQITQTLTRIRERIDRAA